MEDARMSEAGGDAPKIHMPEEIADRLGGISIKTLTDLIRDRGLDTTTLGLAPRSPKGGPQRRLWGMSDAQLAALLAIRRRPSRNRDRR